ncbi:hypothetical protein GCM10010109_91260 [Actinoplanes campanulatus]|nr:hypothetical protein GCM10010109_91260 [Actinoplanes campanulatus]GID42121.1 hypothetical protein Aca09nite_86270 [Actinoplanes campanulatus]
MLLVSGHPLVSGGQSGYPMRVSPSERCPIASDSTVAMVSKAMRHAAPGGPSGDRNRFLTGLHLLLEGLRQRSGHDIMTG